MRAHTHTHATAWRLENSSQVLFLSFRHVGLRDWTHVTRLSAEPPHQLNKIVFFSQKNKNQKLFLKNRSSKGLCHLFKVDEILCLGLRLKANRSMPTSRRVFLTAAREELESTRLTPVSLQVSGFQDAYRLHVARLRASDGYGHVPPTIL